MLVGTQSGAIIRHALPTRHLGHSHGEPLNATREQGTQMKVKHEAALGMNDIMPLILCVGSGKTVLPHLCTDSLRFIDEHTVISKSKDAKTVRWNCETDEVW